LNQAEMVLDGVGGGGGFRGLIPRPLAPGSVALPLTIDD